MIWVSSLNQELFAYKRSEKLGGKRTEVECWGGGRRASENVVWPEGVPDCLEVQRACAHSRGADILVWMSVPYLKVPGENWKPKTSVSVSIWNLIYYIALKFGVRNISDS